MIVAYAWWAVTKNGPDREESIPLSIIDDPQVSQYNNYQTMLYHISFIPNHLSRVYLYRANDTL